MIQPDWPAAGGVRVLLLGGTAEASRLAARLAAEPRFDAMLSLAGATRTPAAAPLPRRVGGFGGAAGLAGWLRQNRIDIVLDATHPYATRISANATQAARETGVASLRLVRPPWSPAEGERWIHAADADAAAAALGDAPRRVLLTVGSKSLAPFHAASIHSYVVRCIDPPAPTLLPQGAELILSRGPFTRDAEADLLRRARIELLVSKNSGGADTAPKLQAAREAGVAVVMIDRPAGILASPVVADEAAAWRWLLQRAGHVPAWRGA